ncbi:MAG: MinD/ParA family protein [Thermococci archaeon]|nr:MinD/ParA family protein [Thermococci archaeon]
MVAIAVTGKGGVGKTSLAANLAVYFTRRGYRTLVIDGDLYLPKLAMHFGILNPRWTIHNLLNKDSKLRPSDVTYKDVRTGVHIIPGSQSIYALKGITQGKLDRIAEEVRKSYDVTIIDTPVGIPFEIVSTFSLASYQLVVLEPGRNPRNHEGKLLEDEARKFRSVGERFSMRTALVLNKVREDMSDLVDSTLVRLDSIAPVLGSVAYDRDFEMSLSEGLPLLAMKGDGEAAEDITLLGQFLETWMNSFREDFEGKNELKTEGEAARAGGVPQES